jgi:hypothetical protein
MTIFAPENTLSHDLCHQKIDTFCSLVDKRVSNCLIENYLGTIKDSLPRSIIIALIRIRSKLFPSAYRAVAQIPCQRLSIVRLRKQPVTLVGETVLTKIK